MSEFEKWVAIVEVVLLAPSLLWVGLVLEMEGKACKGASGDYIAWKQERCRIRDRLKQLQDGKAAEEIKKIEPEVWTLREEFTAWNRERRGREDAKQESQDMLL